MIRTFGKLRHQILSKASNIQYSKCYFCPQAQQRWTIEESTKLFYAAQMYKQNNKDIDWNAVHKKCNIEHKTIDALKSKFYQLQTTNNPNDQISLETNEFKSALINELEYVYPMILSKWKDIDKNTFYHMQIKYFYVMEKIKGNPANIIDFYPFDEDIQLIWRFSLLTNPGNPPPQYPLNYDFINFKQHKQITMIIEPWMKNLYKDEYVFKHFQKWLKFMQLVLEQPFINNMHDSVCNEMINEYKEFLINKGKIQEFNQNLMPTIKQDFIWNTHLLFPTIYQNECKLYHKTDVIWWDHSMYDIHDHWKYNDFTIKFNSCPNKEELIKIEKEKYDKQQQEDQEYYDNLDEEELLRHIP